MLDPRHLLIELFHEAIAAADPARCVPPCLPERPSGRTVVIAAGKAAASMARAVEDHWAGAALEGLAVTRYGHAMPGSPEGGAFAGGGIEVIEASHPVPDDRGHVAAGRLLETVRTLGEDDTLLCLISGGGSALLALPAPGLTLDDKRSINKQLLASGAPIGEMNAVRKHLSAIKGGRLAEAAYPARIVTIGISDVPGDDPSVIASGPTVPDTTTRADALAIIAKYGLDIPPHIRAHLADERSETPKPGDAIFARTEFHMASRPADMVAAVAAAAERMGLDVLSLGADIEGEAAMVGKEQAALAIRHAQARAAGGRPFLIVSGGETTVTHKGETREGERPGRGGRNAEYLLSLALSLEGQQDIYALACDTDGIDGSEDNAGAILDPQTLARARSSIDPQRALDRHDAYSVFEAAGDLVVTGPTRTNVNDLRLILIQPIQNNS